MESRIQQFTWDVTLFVMLDFIAKMSIANKEARESRYWLRLLNRKRLLEDFSEIKFLLQEIEEIILILNSIIKKSRQNLKDPNA